MKAQLNNFGPFKMLKLSFYKPLYSFVLQPHSTTRNRSMGPWQPAEHGHMQKRQKFVKFKQSRGERRARINVSVQNMRVNCITVSCTSIVRRLADGLHSMVGAIRHRFIKVFRLF